MEAWLAQKGVFEEEINGKDGSGSFGQEHVS